MKQVIVIAKYLNMRRGKQIAQGAHASMAAVLFGGRLLETEEVQEWLGGIFTKICVSVDSEKELLEIYEKALQNNLHCALIKDAGLTEFGGVPTYTAVAVGPGKPEDIDKITGHLKLL